MRYPLRTDVQTETIYNKSFAFKNTRLNDFFSQKAAAKLNAIVLVLLRDRYANSIEFS